MRLSIPKSAFLFTGLFIALLSLFDGLVRFGIQHTTSGWIGKVNQLCLKRNQPDIAIFGSSVGEVGINACRLAAQTGQSVYNFSLEATRFPQYQGLIRSFDKNNTQTKTIVIADVFSAFSIQDTIVALDRYLAHLSDTDVYGALSQIQPYLAWKCRYVPFYPYTAVGHTYYMNSWSGWKTYLGRPSTADSLCGSTPVYRRWQKSSDDRLGDIAPFDVAIDAQIVALYSDVIARLRQSGRQVVVLWMPLYVARQQKIKNHQAVKAQMYRLCEAHGARFLDASTDPLCSDKTFFYDSMHLNSTGADRLTDVLGAMLQSKS